MIRSFRFFDENKYNIEDDALYNLNAHENIALGLISWCQRMDLNPIGHQHQFDESTSNHGPGHITRHLVIKHITRHDNFETPHVRIFFGIYDINGINNYAFHLDENVFDNVMRRYENL